MSMRWLLNNAAWSLTNHVMHRGSLMAAAIILARNLETEDFAGYSYFQMTVAMLATYAAMGLGVTASRYFAEVGHERDGKPSPIGTLLAASGFISIAAFLLVLMIPADWLQAGLPVPQWIIALGVAITVANVVPSGGILGLERYRSACLVSLFSAVTMLGIAWLAAAQQSPTLGMWGIISGTGIQLAGQMLVIIRTTSWKVIQNSLSLESNELNKIIKFAGPMFLVSVLAGSSTWVVGRMILSESGEREFSAYSIGLQWLALGMLLPGMISRVILPRLVRSSGTESKNTVNAAASLALSSVLVMTGSSFLIAPWLIKLYGEEYTGFEYIIPAFLGVALFSAPLNTLGNAIVAKDGQISWLILSLASFSTLILILAVSPEASAIWSGVAHISASAIMLAMTWIYGKRKDIF